MRLTPHQQISRKNYLHNLKEGLLPKSLCMWMCGTISCDGSVRFHNKHSLSQFSCSLLNSVEEKWVNQCIKILNENDILYHVNKAGKKWGKQAFEIRLSNLEMKRLYNTILYYGLQNFIIKRKLDKIEKYLIFMTVFNDEPKRI